MHRHRTAPSASAGRSSSSPRSAMIALIGGVALILEGGNAYAHQREAQNASDAVANAGADRARAAALAGTAKTDARRRSVSMANVSTANYLNRLRRLLHRLSPATC